MYCANTETRFGRRIVLLFLKSLVPIALILLTVGFIYARWIDKARLGRIDSFDANYMSKDFVMSVMENEARFFYAALALAVILAIVMFRVLRKIKGSSAAHRRRHPNKESCAVRVRSFMYP